MIVTRDGVTWDVEAPDDFWSRLWPTWEPDTLATVDRFCRSDATMVDVGAWVGPVSLWAARWGPVLSVEPDPVALEYLERNVAQNAPGCVEVAPYALGRVTGRGAEIVPRGTYGDSMSYLSYDEIGVPVRTFRLPDLLVTYDVGSVSLVKVDIEGGEVWVLDHMASYCAEAGIPLLVATHEQWWNYPFDPSWLDGFDHVEGDWHGWGSVLCW